MPVLVPVEEVGGLAGPEALVVGVGLVVDVGADDQRLRLKPSGGGNVRPSASSDSIVSPVSAMSTPVVL